MDDDQPLSLLAKGPAKADGQFDDDTPLACLAEPKPTRSNSKGNVTPKASPRLSVGSTGSAATSKGKGKGKGKQATPSKRKRSGSSSSSSSGSSSSSSSDSDDDAPLAKKGGASKAQKLKLLKKKQSEVSLIEDTSMSIKKKDRGVKEQVVAELLCRWWYVLPDWPPDDPAYYEEELKKRSLRRVSIEQWEWVPEVDETGRRKVYELSQFRGLFRNSAGELIDTRPRETCPCYSNFMKKELSELYDMLVIAYENQLKDLINSKFNEERFEQELKAALTRVRDKAHQAKQLGGVRRKSSSGLTS